MTYSLNEVEALAKRAARGAGYSWGMAEEVAKAMRWLAAHNLPSLAPFANLLLENDAKTNDNGVPMSIEERRQADALCPFAFGALLCDRADEIGQSRAIKMGPVSHPILTVPFLAFVAARLNACVTIAWHDLKLCSDGKTLWVSDPQSQLQKAIAQDVTCSLSEAKGGAPCDVRARCPIDQQSWIVLNDFAKRTYAPASEQSRMLGAGAGNSDND